MIFGKDSSLLKDGRVCSAQSLSGTGALRLGFEFIRQELHSHKVKILIPSPTWANHQNIIQRSNLQIEQYPYYDPKTKKVRINDLIAFLENTQENNVVLLHACAHNPTGVDPTTSDWEQIAEVMQRKKLIPFFDSAYQGFASGDILKDIEPVRYFAKKFESMFVSQSYAKNMGLYGQRVGCLHIVAADK